MSVRILTTRAPALLVDDHPDVLIGIGAYLESIGFDVVRARSGDEALACIASDRTFVLLVTDYAMPGLNGTTLARLALEQVPELKILIITGYPSDAGLFDRPPNVALLAKPFRRADLVAVLRSLFATGRPTLPASHD